MADKLVNSIIGVFGGLTGVAFGKEILVFIISLLPILELRGGLIAAALLKLNPVSSYVISILMSKILNKMRKSKINFFNKIAGFLDKKVEKNKEKIEKFGYWGVVLFVGVPLPRNRSLDWFFNCIGIRTW